MNFTQTITQHVSVIDSLRESENLINEAASLIVSSFKSGGKVLFIGNGGSAADAQHLATELMVRFKAERCSLPAFALTTDSSLVTAHTNDYDFNTLFSRQIEAVGRKNDILIAISTSGKSQNVIQGVQAAKKLGVNTIALTGHQGGDLKDLVDYCINVPSDETARIQEAHILIGHYLCQVVDENFS